MKSKIEITQDQANELLRSLSEYPIPYKYSTIILIIQKWLAEKFQEEDDINAFDTSTVKERVTK